MNMKITYKLPMANSNSFYAHLIQQPHILIAGCTGSGKSVLENALLHEILLHSFENTLVLIDPKKVELYDYKHLPHCIAYADNAKSAVIYLQKTVDIMHSRYAEMQKQRIKQYQGNHIYVIIDELADLMTQAKKEVYPLLQQIGQLARACNIHLICCTQAPNRKVIPAELTLNFTDRIALRCQSAIESRQIINVPGAEKLPRYGECLYLKDGYVNKYPVQMRMPNELKQIIEYWEKVYYRP